MTKTALILAPNERCLQPVYGIPVLRRLVLILLQLGFENVRIIGQTHLFASIVGDRIPSRSFNPCAGVDSLDAILEGLELQTRGPVLLLCGEVIIDRYTLAQLLNVSEEKPVCLTKSKGGSPLERVYLASGNHIAPLVHALWSAESPSDDVAQELVHVWGTQAIPHLLADHPEGVHTAEYNLANALARQTETDDGFIARHFDRKISKLISIRLARKGLSPNRITLAGMTIGLLGALLLSVAGYWPHLVGSLLFVMCVIVDGVDGEVARLTLKESLFGHYLDITTDNLVHFAIFVGIAYGLFHDTGHHGYLTLLWFLLFGFAISALAVYQCILRLSDEELKQSPKQIRFMALLSNRDFAYLVAVLAFFDRLDWFLVAAAIGSYVFAIALWLMNHAQKTRKALDKVTLDNGPSPDLSGEPAPR